MSSAVWTDCSLVTHPPAHGRSGGCCEWGSREHLCTGFGWLPSFPAFWAPAQESDSQVVQEVCPDPCHPSPARVCVTQSYRDWLFLTPSSWQVVAAKEMFAPW